MTNEEPLSDDLADLFASERRAPGAPEGAQSRLAARLALLPALAAVPLAVTSTMPAASASVGRAWTRTHAWLASVAFVAGVVTGVGAMVVARPLRGPVAPPAPPALPVAAPVIVAPVIAAPVIAAPVIAAPVIAAPVIAAPVIAAPIALPPAPSVHPAPAASSSIAAEQVILDAARVALGREDAAAALAATETHAQRFPRGQLSEEREAIAIQALVLLGRPADARARTDRFARAYPTSALLPVLREALGDSR